MAKRRWWKRKEKKIDFQNENGCVFFFFLCVLCSPIRECKWMNRKALARMRKEDQVHISLNAENEMKWIYLNSISWWKSNWFLCVVCILYHCNHCTIDVMLLLHCTTFSNKWIFFLFEWIDGGVSLIDDSYFFVKRFLPFAMDLLLNYLSSFYRNKKPNMTKDWKTDYCITITAHVFILLK